MGSLGFPTLPQEMSVELREVPMENGIWEGYDVISRPSCSFAFPSPYGFYHRANILAMLIGFPVQAGAPPLLEAFPKTPPPNSKILMRRHQHDDVIRSDFIMSAMSCRDTLV